MQRNTKSYVNGAVVFHYYHFQHVRDAINQRYFMGRLQNFLEILVVESRRHSCTWINKYRATFPYVVKHEIYHTLYIYLYLFRFSSNTFPFYPVRILHVEIFGTTAEPATVPLFETFRLVKVKATFPTRHQITLNIWATGTEYKLCCQIHDYNQLLLILIHLLHTRQRRFTQC